MPKHARHPARLAALIAGEKKWLGPDCRKHGVAPHHTSSGQCVACNRERSALQAVAKSARRERYVKLADRPERLAALARGAHIYWGPLCLNGHAGKRPDLSPRYTRSTHCVACAQARAAGKSAADLMESMAPNAAVKLADHNDYVSRRLPRPQLLLPGIARRLRVLIRKAG